MPARFPGVRVRGRLLLQERAGPEPRGAAAKVPPPLAVTGLLGVPDGPCGGVFHGPLCVWTFLVPLKLSLSIAPWGPAWSAERGSGIKPPSSSASRGLHRETRCSGDLGIPTCELWKPCNLSHRLQPWGLGFLICKVGLWIYLVGSEQMRSRA